MAIASRKHLYKKKYNISIEEYNELLEKQIYVCKICKKSSNKTLCIDHNHETGKIRGLLCHRCNSAIGLLDENLDNLESAIMYLKEYN